MFRISTKLIFTAFAVVTMFALQLSASVLAPLSAAAAGVVPFDSVGKIVDTNGSILASGTLVASRVVLSAANQFVDGEGEVIDVSQISWVSPSGESSNIESYIWLGDYLSSVRRYGIDGNSAQNNALVMLVLSTEISRQSHPAFATSRFRNQTYRLLAGYPKFQYSSRNNLRNRLNATSAGETINTRFGSVSGRIYHTGDLKWGYGSEGSPVLSQGDGVWAIEGIVIGGTSDGSDTLALQIDNEILSFVDQAVSDSGSSRSPAERGSYQDINNSKDTAIFLEMDHGLRSSISPNSDQDYHRIRVETEGNYVIETVGSTDTRGELRNDQLQLISQDDDSAGSVNYRIEALLEPGNYYVVTSPFSSSEGGDYGIGVIHVDGINPFDDAGFSDSDIQTLGVNDSGNYRMDLGSEADTFSIIVDQPGHLIIHTTGDVDLLAKLFTTTTGSSAPFTSNEIDMLYADQDNFLGGGGNVLVDAFVPAGEYMLSVSAASGYEFGEYGIVTAFNPTSAASLIDGSNYEGLAKATPILEGQTFEANLAAGEPAVGSIYLNSGGSVNLTISTDANCQYIVYGNNWRELATSSTAASQHDISLSYNGDHIYLVVFSDQPQSIEIVR